jgi:hypothetical protein
MQIPAIFGSFMDAIQHPLSQEIFDIPVAEVESIVEPDGVGNDIRRESVALICSHRPILAILAN